MRAMGDDWKAKYQAPPGHIYLCGACGKWNRNRVDVGDEACLLNAVLVVGDAPIWEDEPGGGVCYRTQWWWMRRRSRPCTNGQDCL